MWIAFVQPLPATETFMNPDTNNPYGSPVESVPDSLVRASQSREMTLRRVDILSCGKMLGILYVLLGVFFAAFMLLMMLAGIAIEGGGNAAAGAVGGVVMAIFIPVFYGAIGFFGGMLLAVMYNVCA